MRSYDKADRFDRATLKKLGKVEPWMLDLLKLNPEYVHWGPHEDYMCGSEQAGWRAPVTVENWKTFGWQLDELNECVHFYFEINRNSESCAACDGSGQNPATKVVSDTFYDHDHDGVGAWRNQLTQDELDALVAQRRVGCDWIAEKGRWVARKPHMTAAMFNAMDYSHDAINRHILVKTRAKRLGVYGLCKTCKGHGYNYTEVRPHVGLVLWWIHPRKGASRGVEISTIEQSDLPAVFAFLAKAAKRNADRFQAVVNATAVGSTKKLRSLSR